MNSPLIAGLFAGWTAVQVAVGVFFVQVYASRRREGEYLLFGFVCFALAVVDAGFSVVPAPDPGIPSTGRCRRPMAHAGAFFATALNFHFVLQFVAPAQVRRFAPGRLRRLGVVLLVVLFATGWWVPAGRARHAEHALRRRGQSGYRYPDVDRRHGVRRDDARRTHARSSVLVVASAPRAHVRCAGR